MNVDADANGTLFLPPCPLARAWAVAAALGPSRNSGYGRSREGKIRTAAVGESALSSFQSAETRRLVTPFNCS